MKRSLVIACCAGFLSACQATPPAPGATPAATTGFDVLITGGRIVDGTGAPW